MFALMIGTAMLVAPTQSPDHHGAVVRTTAQTPAYEVRGSVSEERTMQAPEVVDETPGAGDERRDGARTPSHQFEHLEGVQRDWSGMQTALGALMVLASIVIGVRLIVLLVVLFEFIPRPEERVWPVRIARTAVVANLVLALALAAFIHIG